MADNAFVRNWLLDELKERYVKMTDLLNEFNEGKIKDEKEAQEKFNIIQQSFEEISVSLKVIGQNMFQIMSIYNLEAKMTLEILTEEDKKITALAEIYNHYG